MTKISRVATLSSVFLLLSCADHSFEKAQQAKEANVCKSFAQEQNRDQKWLEACIAGDNETIKDGVYTRASSLSQDQLCTEIGLNFSNILTVYIQQAATDRKIDCYSYIYAKTLPNLEKAPVQVICPIWYYRNQHPAFVAASDAAVASRKLDCVAAINGMQQNAALQQQLKLQRQLNEQSEAIAISNNEIIHQNNIHNQQLQSMQQQIQQNQFMQQANQQFQWATSHQ